MLERPRVTFSAAEIGADTPPVSFLESAPAQEAVRQLQSISENPENFIDKGGAGAVYKLPAGMCMKVMEARHDSPNSNIMKLGNTLEQEARFLERIEHFSFAGARTPEYLGYIRSKNFLAILMEELEAVNLQKVLNGEAALPPSFSFDRFFDALEQYMDHLNTDFHAVHGDLEPRNVMIDIKSGNPRIIDFGNAKWLSKDPAPERVTKALIKQDWDKLDSMAEQVRAYQAKQT
jgi:serine/threonine protein kinase